MKVAHAVMSVVAVLVVVGSGAGCGSSSKPAPEPPRTGAVVPGDDPTCPVSVAGTSVTVEDTDTGAAFVFVTTGDVAAVRTRARALADAHNAHHARMRPPIADGGSAADPHAGHAGHTTAPPPAAAGIPAPPPKWMGTMIAAHSTAAVTEIAGGARVEFTAHDPKALQDELRMHASHLTAGSCVM